ncbi:hypothetical protein DEO72_LG3g2204 [Vigna unguiculata]|uniref:Uncharacterized protein n=1 Tax=Vigna unguiculata TaxID=3917 RepID=A0A4D6LH68_VIGUN|nr:hypothetical protein DEO72_LG3g2204 [Vigna unguiculata]
MEAENQNHHAGTVAAAAFRSALRPTFQPCSRQPPQFRSLSNCGHGCPSTSRVVEHSSSACMSRQHTTTRGEVMLSDVVGNDISGIIHKWVNYGCGWRPRWFVLHDSVHPS